jgi:hypothetical protein
MSAGEQVISWQMFTPRHKDASRSMASSACHRHMPNVTKARREQGLDMQIGPLDEEIGHNLFRKGPFMSVATSVHLRHGMLSCTGLD